MLELPDTDDYTFSDWLDSTADLQIQAYGVDPADLIDDGYGGLTEAGKIFAGWNMFAAMVEIGELSNEIGWKPWATSSHFNREQVIAEAVDLLHFTGNLLRMARCTGPELTAAYKAKQRKNLQRQLDGYTGVAEKCPSCYRALDDPNVTCTKQRCANVNAAASDR